MTARQAAEPAARQPVWDWSVRLVHWLLVVCVFMAWRTGEDGHIDAHLNWGYGALALVLFRVVWGFVGPPTARFSQFVKGPKAVIAHGRALFGRGYHPGIGHNALGALSVLALLAALLVQTGTGLFAYDSASYDIEVAEGALAILVEDSEALDQVNRFHGAFVNILLALIGLHLAAIAFYLLVKRDNLVGPMVTGRKRIAAEPPTGAPPPWWLAPVLLGGSIGLVAALRSQFWLAVG